VEKTILPVRENLVEIHPWLATFSRSGKIMSAQEIGQIVRETRKAIGLRQDELASVAGVGLRLLVELERGKPSVRLDKMESVLAALGLEVGVQPRRDQARPPEP
jgi:y4mF family transcriptional regulator